MTVPEVISLLRAFGGGLLTQEKETGQPWTE